MRLEPTIGTLLRQILQKINNKNKEGAVWGPSCKLLPAKGVIETK